MRTVITLVLCHLRDRYFGCHATLGEKRCVTSQTIAAKGESCQSVWLYTFFVRSLFFSQYFLRLHFIFVYYFKVIVVLTHLCFFFSCCLCCFYVINVCLRRHYLNRHATRGKEYCVTIQITAAIRHEVQSPKCTVENSHMSYLNNFTLL